MMNSYDSFDALPKIEQCILTMGSFDGLHLGHQTIFERLKKLHQQTKKEIVVLTFQQHPRSVLDKLSPLALLTTFNERVSLLKEKFSYIHHFVAIPFTTEFAQIRAEEFISDILVKYFNPSIIVVGNDHQFGKNRLGNIFLLKNFAGMFQYQVEEISSVLVEQNKTSSTLIRHAIENGDIASANKHLGYFFFFEGKVIEGRKLGKTIGFPTANIQLTFSDKIIPKIGVYAVNIIINKKQTIPHKAMMNIGYSPTVDRSQTVKIEVHIFDFNENIYGQNITVQMKTRIRDEKKFETIEHLKNQLQQDKKVAESL